MIDIGFDFADRRVVVAGGTRGTGLHIARAFAEAGAEVAVTGTKILPTLYDADLSAFAYHQLQLTNSDAIDSFVDRIGEVDVLVTAAGAHLPGALDEHEREFLTHSARLGFIGPQRLAHQLRPRLCSTRVPLGGVVVHTAASTEWLALSAPPAEAEAHLRAQTAQIGRTWARLGARVNTVLSPRGPRPPRPGGAPRPERIRPSGALLTRQETPALAAEPIAPLTLFLASAGAAALTGQTFTVGRGR